MQKINFQDLPDTSTPVNATNLNAVQSNTEDAIAELENVELLAVSSTAPATCSTGDKYYNTSTKKIYTATGTDTWGTTGVDPISSILYIVFSTQESYAWDGSDLVSVGGGSGLNVHDSYDTSTTEPYSANYVNGVAATIPSISDTAGTSTTDGYSQNYINSNLFSGNYNDLTNKPTIPTISNSYGTSTSAGYSQNMVNTFNTYSTTETRIGTFGSTAIYRKTISGTNNGTYTEGGMRYTWFSHGITNLNRVVRLDCYINGSSRKATSSYGGISLCVITSGGNAGKIQLGASTDEFSTSASVTFVIEYTKS